MKKKGNCITFPPARIVAFPARHYPNRSLFEEDEEVRRWLIDWLSAADIRIDDELFWLCYEHPLPPEDEEEQERHEPDLMDHLIRTMAQVWAFRRSMVYKVISQAMSLINAPPSSFRKYLPTRDTCWHDLPGPLWPYFNKPEGAMGNVGAKGGGRG